MIVVALSIVAVRVPAVSWQALLPVLCAVIFWFLYMTAADSAQYRRKPVACLCGASLPVVLGVAGMLGEPGYFAEAASTVLLVLGIAVCWMLIKRWKGKTSKVPQA